jgi:F420-dependent oxidoreductase-like protein
MTIKLAVALNHSRDLQGAVATAIAADQLGYDSVWMPEAYGSDAVTMLSYIAARTSSIKLATGVLQMPARTPANTAMTAMTLDELSEGRLILGLGVSGPQVVEGWHGVPYRKPLAMTREYVEIIRRILRREEPLHFQGDTFRIPLDPTTMPPLKSSMRPRRADIPIVLAANGPKNIALAAEIADGWLPTLYAPEHDDVVAGPVAEGLARRAPELGPFTVNTGVQAYVGDDIDACRDLARPYLALYIGGMGSREQNFYKDIVTRYGYGDAAATIQDLYLSGRQQEAAAAIPAELIDKLSLVGPREVVRDRLAVWSESRIDTVIIRSADPSTLETMRSIADEL